MEAVSAQVSIPPDLHEDIATLALRFEDFERNPAPALSEVLDLLAEAMTVTARLMEALK